jgi:hypothetical protein
MASPRRAGYTHPLRKTVDGQMPSHGPEQNLLTTTFEAIVLQWMDDSATIQVLYNKRTQ